MSYADVISQAEKQVQSGRATLEDSNEMESASTFTDLLPGAPLRRLLDQFLDYIIDYRDYSERTRVAYKRDCMRFIRLREREGLSLDARHVTTPEVRLFLASLDLGPNSVRRTLYALSSFFSHLVDLNIIPANPAAAIKPPKRKRKIPYVPTREQSEALLDACDTPKERTAIELLLLAGLRRGELLGLDVADVAADFSQLHVCGKGGRERVVPISSGLRRVLVVYLDQRESEHRALFINQVGSRMGISTFCRLFERLLQRAGLQDTRITPHSLRHAFASQLVRAGVDVATISELLGHSNIATTSLYLHTTPEIKKNAVECLCRDSESGERLYTNRSVLSNVRRPAVRSADPGTVL